MTFTKKLLSCCLLLILCRIPAQTINTSLVYKVAEPTIKTGRPPLLVILHGYGANEDDFFNLHQSLDQRLLVFCLRGPYPVNQGYSWYGLQRTPDKELIHNYKEATESRAKILSFISQACKVYKADSTQVFIMGFSQGAILCYDIARFSPTKIKGVVALSGRMMDDTKKMQTDALKVANVKFFIAHGKSDDIILYKHGEEASAFLQSKKNNILFKSYEMAHTVVEQEVKDIAGWLTANISK